MYRVGLVSVGAPDSGILGPGMVRDFAKRGYAVDRNIIFDRRAADTRRSNRPCATTTSTHSVSPDSMSLSKLNPVEPPWYGPVCPVVLEWWHRQVSPYPNHRRFSVIRSARIEAVISTL